MLTMTIHGVTGHLDGSTVSTLLHCNDLEIVQQVKAIAESIGATPAQVSLSWILAKYPHSVVIPGTTKSKRVRENALAAQVELSGEQMKVLDGLAKNAQGGRYA